MEINFIGTDIFLYIGLFLLACVFSLCVTPLVRNLAKHFCVFDIPSARKVHDKPTPLLGGISIFISLNSTLLIGSALGITSLRQFFSSYGFVLLIGQIIIMLLGAYDDIKRLQPKTKFMFQILVGMLLYFSGFNIQNIFNPFSGEAIQLGIFSFFLTILWVVGITNALNLIDGLDGLAAGTSLIASITIFAIALYMQNLAIAAVALALAGSLLGFLKYNFHPAQIFLGDSGSLLLGFLLSILSIRGSYKGATLITVMAPILVLGFPIMETLLSMIRRLLNSLIGFENPAKQGKWKRFLYNGSSIFEADKEHAHHRLLKIGFSQKKVVFILYALCIFLSLLAFSTVAFSNINILIFIGAILVAFVIGIRSLDYKEFKILDNGLLLPIFNMPVVSKRMFQAFFDLMCISLVYYLTVILAAKNLLLVEQNIFFEAFPILLTIKIIVFYFMGIYKSSWVYTSIEDMLIIFKSVFISSALSLVLVSVIFGLRVFGGIIFFVLDFYLLLSLTAGARLSYRLLLNYRNSRAKGQGIKILIYGAGHRGSTVLKEIKHNGSFSFSPVGFIDDDLRKKGRTMHSCPILGSIDDIDRLVEDNRISEIIISTDKITSEKIEKLKKLCEQSGIRIRQFEYRFYEFPGPLDQHQ